MRKNKAQNLNEQLSRMKRLMNFDISVTSQLRCCHFCDFSLTYRMVEIGVWLYMPMVKHRIYGCMMICHN